MPEFSNQFLLPTPVRALLSDDPAQILSFASDCFHKGISVALATLVVIRGGAARTLGSHVVVAVDGRFCGYVSGGCVEAAVAAEALLAIEAGRDRMVMFGDGSPFIDIILPCGGGISVTIHILRSSAAIDSVLECLGERQTIGLEYLSRQQTLQALDAPQSSRWQEGKFMTVYRPRTRLVISGQTIEAETVARLGETAGYDVVMVRSCEGALGVGATIDAYTAVVVLHHDLDQEASILDVALKSPGFYIGALGSTRTHRRRIMRLKALGYDDTSLRRIKAPIGIFGPARDSSSLALYVLADIAATRSMVYE